MEAGWGLIEGVGELGVALVGVGVAGVGEALVAGVWAEPVEGVAAEAVAAEAVAAGGFTAGWVAAGMRVALGDWVDTGGDGRKRSVLGASTPRGGVGMAGLAGEEDASIGL